MTHPVQSLQEEIDQTIHLLDLSFLFSFTREERDDLRGKATDLSKKLASVEGSFLTVGLLGGTGVGKSTLMNALAGSEIASTSHRRPHTDDILIYRYVEANAVPNLTLAEIPWREITHQEKAIRQILLCDLPDFDSLVGEHSRRVLDFMEHLDVLIWVTSPEKYADGRFYDLLGQVPKARQNFYFVLNKVDLLFDGNSLETGYEQMAKMAGQFQDHIKRSGIVAPALYTLSSRDAVRSDALAPWNHFPAFRQQIFQQRDAKQIREIKSANIDVEVRQLLSLLDKEVINLKSFERLVADAVGALETQRSQWIQAGQEVIHLWLQKRVRQEVVSRQANPACLVGPGRNIFALVEGWKKRLADENVRIDPAPFVPPDEIIDAFRKRLEWIGDRLHHHILRENLPPAFQQWIEDKLDTSTGIEDLKERFSSVVALGLQERLRPSQLRFKALQFVTYTSLLIFFLFAIGGESAWLGVFEDPGWRGIVHLLVSSIRTLFSGKGLAALGSYVILNLLFALRFYNRYRRIRDSVAEKLIHSLKVGLEKAWEDQLGAIGGQLKELRREIQGRISTISSLTAS